MVNITGVPHNCPLCSRPGVSPGSADYGERITVVCDCCGQFTYTASARAVLDGRELSDVQRAALMHRIRWACDRRDFVLDSQTIEAWMEDPVIPSPTQQIENLVLWLGTHLQSAGERVDIVEDQFQAVIGAADADGFTWVVDQARDLGLIEGHESRGMSEALSLIHATLTLRGWQTAAELQKTKATSRTAFMAMKFGDAGTDTLYREFLVPAVKQTGFELRRLDDEQPAGLIDDQLRVRIRQARFLVVDLTHGNKGAYWEAGFAEGLEKPVIYLCRDDVFSSSDLSLRPHFDTSHLVTIIWKPEALREAAQRLKACIRATLPHEAVMDDPHGAGMP